MVGRLNVRYRPFVDSQNRSLKVLRASVSLMMWASRSFSSHQEPQT